MSSDFNVLTLDGGGIKGIALVMMLQKMYGENATIYDKFHYIAGTSTGGLLALLLGLKKKTLRDALDIYLSGNPDVMRGQELVSAVYEKSRFASDPIENEYMNTYGETQKLSDYAAQYIPMVMVTSIRMDKLPSSSFLFTNYNNNKSKFASTNDAYIWEAARSTSAAPSYWKPYTRSVEMIHEFIDSDIVKNETSNDSTIDAKINALEQQISKLDENEIKPGLLSKYVDVDNPNEQKLYNLNYNMNQRSILVKEYKELNHIKKIKSSEMRAQYEKERDAPVFIDGGVGINNPSVVAYAECATMNKTPTKFLSLGCGTVEYGINDDNTYYRQYKDYYTRIEEKNYIVVDLFYTVVNSIKDIATQMQKFLSSAKTIDDEIKRLSNSIRDDNRDNIENVIDDLKQSKNILSMPKKKILSELFSEENLINFPLEKNDTVKIIDEITDEYIGISSKQYVSKLWDIVSSVTPIPLKSIAATSVIAIKSMITIYTYVPHIKLMIYLLLFISGYYDIYQTADYIVQLQKDINKKIKTYTELQIRSLNYENTNPFSILGKIVTGILNMLNKMKNYHDVTKLKNIKDIFMEQAFDYTNTLKEQSTQFVSNNLVGSLTGTHENIRIISSLIGDKFMRYEPTYEYKINLAETNIRNIMDMMTVVNKYIKHNINTVVDTTNNAIDQNTVAEKQRRIGKYIQQNIWFEQQRIKRDLGIGSNPGLYNYEFEDIVALDLLIDECYRPYFEAYYLMLDMLKNYLNNKILDNGNPEAELEYLDYFTNKIIKTKKMDKISLLYTLEYGFYDSQSGGMDYEKLMDNVAEYDKYEEEYMKIKELKRAKAGEFYRLRLDELILSNLVKRDDSGGKFMNGCKINEKVVFANSDSELYFNTCGNIYRRFLVFGTTKKKVDIKYNVNQNTENIVNILIATDNMDNMNNINLSNYPLDIEINNGKEVLYAPDLYTHNVMEIEKTILYLICQLNKGKIEADLNLQLNIKNGETKKIKINYSIKTNQLAQNIDVYKNVLKTKKNVKIFKYIERGTQLSACSTRSKKLKFEHKYHFTSDVIDSRKNIYELDYKYHQSVYPLYYHEIKNNAKYSIVVNVKETTTLVDYYLMPYVIINNKPIEMFPIKLFFETGFTPFKMSVHYMEQSINLYYDVPTNGFTYDEKYKDEYNMHCKTTSKKYNEALINMLKETKEGFNNEFDQNLLEIKRVHDLLSRGTNVQCIDTLIKKKMNYRKHTCDFIDEYNKITNDKIQ